MTFTHRLATEADLPAIHALMDVAIAEHLKAFLNPAQVELSKSIMGLDTQLIADRTYFLVEEDGRLAGCGGWSQLAHRGGRYEHPRFLGTAPQPDGSRLGSVGTFRGVMLNFVGHAAFHDRGIQDFAALRYYLCRFGID